MGMIVTLYLISANVYNAVDAPHGRGFSNIEVWMIGAQIPILLALWEYGFILYLKKHANKAQNQVQAMTAEDQAVKLDDRIKQMDSVTMTISFLFFVTFALVYWITMLN
jgi:hypothetical protein